MHAKGGNPGRSGRLSGGHSRDTRNRRTHDASARVSGTDRDQDAIRRPSADRPPPSDRGGRNSGSRTLSPPSTLTAPPARPTLHVGDCSNDTVSNIIQGVYTTKKENHGKPVYKKDGVPGNVTVLIY
mmetsp:Transcript_19178/g.34115  ORF Transcript_19178/g.34115 Transcript_19178/m.34115 type:complete len:127 (-) Transcript_19178:25-405(-)